MFGNPDLAECGQRWQKDPIIQSGNKKKMQQFQNKWKHTKSQTCANTTYSPLEIQIWTMHMKCTLTLNHTNLRQMFKNEHSHTHEKICGKFARKCMTTRHETNICKQICHVAYVWHMVGICRESKMCTHTHTSNLKMYGHNHNQHGKSHVEPKCILQKKRQRQIANNQETITKQRQIINIYEFLWNDHIIKPKIVNLSEFKPAHQNHTRTITKQMQSWKQMKKNYRNNVPHKPNHMRTKLRNRDGNTGG